MSVSRSIYVSKLHLWIGEFFYAFALFFAKSSVLFFYWRMFRVADIKVPIMILYGACVIWITIRTIMGIFHCVPVQAYWDASIKHAVCNINDTKFFLGTLTVHIVIDICILILPITQIRKLKLPVSQKLAAIVIFGFGILEVPHWPYAPVVRVAKTIHKLGDSWLSGSHMKSMVMFHE